MYPLQTMKPENFFTRDRSLTFLETLTEIWTQGHHQKIPRVLFLSLCLNLVLAIAVHATTGDTISHTQAYALSLLGLTTISLSIYLFVVMFQPERF